MSAGKGYAMRLALQVYSCVCLYGVSYSAAIKNAIDEMPWTWNIKQQVADQVLLQVIILLKGVKA